MTLPLPAVLQACFDSIRARLGRCQLEHFELPPAAEMNPSQVGVALTSPALNPSQSQNGDKTKAAAAAAEHAGCQINTALLALACCHGPMHALQGSLWTDTSTAVDGRGKAKLARGPRVLSTAYAAGHSRVPSIVLTVMAGHLD
jgi:hypothetical protein